VLLDQRREGVAVALVGGGSLVEQHVAVVWLVLVSGRGDGVEHGAELVGDELGDGEPALMGAVMPVDHPELGLGPRPLLALGQCLGLDRVDLVGGEHVGDAVGSTAQVLQ
jgi:hypothetical protein